MSEDPITFREAWGRVRPIFKFLILATPWTIFWLWMAFIFGNLDFCPAETLAAATAKYYHHRSCGLDWINAASIFTSVIMWVVGIWAIFEYLDPNGERRY